MDSATEKISIRCTCGQKETHDRFRARVKEKGGSPLVAELLGCSRSYVDMIRSRTRCPGRRVLVLIEQHLGIPTKDWFGMPGA